jgi:succinate dehydrogenase flavin-adding protein (antitoxin of CptAB toxin-antitoxin module)
MLELDELLLRYMECCYESAAVGEKAAFEALLALPDSELMGYLLLGHSPESPALASVVRTILGDAAR